MKVRVKAQAAEGAENCGAANAAERVLGFGVNKNISVATDNRGDKLVLKALEGYFNSLSPAATNKKNSLSN